MQLQLQVLPKLLPQDHMDTCEAMPGISAVSDMERSETSASSALRMSGTASGFMGKITGPISRGKAREASKLKIPPAVVFESIVLFEKISSVLL